MNHSVIEVKLFVVLLESHLFLFTVCFTMFNTQPDSQFNILQNSVETEPTEFWKMTPPPQHTPHPRTHTPNKQWGQRVLFDEY